MYSVLKVKKTKQVNHKSVAFCKFNEKKIKKKQNIHTKIKTKRKKSEVAKRSETIASTVNKYNLKLDLSLKIDTCLTIESRLTIE